jgi:hypothetical protein
MNKLEKLEFHNYFDDNSHLIDSFVRNRCEAELLAIVAETALILDIELDLNSEASQEGGFKEKWKLLGENSAQISLVLVVITIILSRVPITDTEIENLEKEIKRLTIEEKKLNIKKLKEELEKVGINKASADHIGEITKYVDNNLKVVKRRSNLYSHLANYPKVTEIGFNIIDEAGNFFSDERNVKKDNFRKFILGSNKLKAETDNYAEIEIISPVLREGRYRWKGIYKEAPITFEMQDNEFKNQVLMETISFKHGSTINCILHINRELDEVGEIKITGYAVSTVIETIENGNTSITIQGKRYKQAKKFQESQKDMFK